MYLSELVGSEVEVLEGRGKVVLLGFRYEPLGHIRLRCKLKSLRRCCMADGKKYFSQGSALAAMTLLSGEIEKTIRGASIGGIVGMSGWLPFMKEIGDVLMNCSLSGVGAKRSAVRGYVRKLLDSDSVPDEGEGTYSIVLAIDFFNTKFER